MGAVKSNDIWFDDGDIVLSVTEDDVEHQFRVHRAILAIASPVFRDMLSLSQPSDGEGLPVTMQGDAVQDLTALLRELYIEREPQIVTLDVALGILRLSHKYHITGLHQRMKLRLQEDWPLKYSDYLARMTFLGSPENRVSQAFKIIETAQRYDAKELLPAAFYELYSIGNTQYQQILENLSVENVRRLWIGRLRVEQRLRLFAGPQFKSPPLMWKRVYIRRNEAISPLGQTIFEYRKKYSYCAKDPRYYGQYPSLFGKFRTKLAERLLDGVSGLAALQQLACEDFDLCSNCKVWFKDVLEDKAQELWENIPTDFDLPPIDSELYSKSLIRAL